MNRGSGTATAGAVVLAAGDFMDGSIACMSGRRHDFCERLRSERLVGQWALPLGADFSGLLKSTPLRSAKLRLNIENLSDKDYLGTINTVTSGPATYRPAPARAVQLTLSAEI